MPGHAGSTRGSDALASNLTRLDVEHETSGAIGLIVLDGVIEFVFEGMLDTDIERQAHGRARRQCRRVHGIDADLVVNVFLDAADAPVIDVDGAEDVTRQCSGRIGALQLVAK